MKFPKFEQPEGSSSNMTKIHGINVSDYRLSFIEKNFGITKQQLLDMDRLEARSWIIKTTWITSFLWSRTFETTPDILIAEEHFGIDSFDKFIKLTPEEFLGKGGLLEKVYGWIKDNEY